MRICKTPIILLFSFLTTTAKAQQPQLWLEGKSVMDTFFLDGFEDGTISPFTIGVDFPWTIDSSNASEGNYFARSTENPSSVLELSIAIPAMPNRQATLLFDIKTDGAEEFFWINNQTIHVIPYSPAFWLTLEFDLPPGQYDFKWTHAWSNLNPTFLNLDNVRIVTRTLGVLRIEDGTEGAGKVLTSDAYGGASWQKLDATSQIDTTDKSGLNVIFDPDTAGTNCAFDPVYDDGVGILVMNAPSKGFSSLCSATGFFSTFASEYGFRAIQSGDAAFYAEDALDDAFYAENAFDNGFVADNSGRYGFMSQNAFESGFYAENSGEYGFLSGDSEVAGFITIESGGWGMVASSSEDHGFYSYEAGGDGFRAEGNSEDGFYSLNSGEDGFAAEDAFRHGFYALGSRDRGFYSNGSLSEGFYAGQSGTVGFTSFQANDDGFLSINSGGFAGYFSGAVEVTGNLSKGGGSFKIDHPLDPENKFLYHSFVESPDMMNVYNGNIILDENGEAVVELPEYFEALNRDFRYQLTCIGGFARIYIKEEIRNNRFTISGGFEGLKVSWQVTGIRQDPYANMNRIEVEVEKSPEFIGQYIHPGAYDMPFENGFDYIKLGRKTLEELRAE